MKKLKCWLISTVFLVSLFGGRGAIALDLLNLSGYMEDSPVRYGKNVIVRQDAATGKKWLSYPYDAGATEEGTLTFSGLNVSGDIEIIVDVAYATEFELKLLHRRDDGTTNTVSLKRFEDNQLFTENYTMEWLVSGVMLSHSTETSTATRVKLSINKRILKLYDAEKDELLIDMDLFYPFITCTDIEVKGIDSSKDELYHLSINTDSEFDKGKQAGIQQCVANPASCGITSGGGSAIKLTNISTRATIQGGVNDVIAGFIISGTGSQKVVIRGSGLEDGVNPKITVHKFPSGDVVASNDDWQVQTAPNSAIPDQFATEPTNAALLLTLPAGAYTAIMSSVGAKGLGLIEVNAID